jgi:hypothetical protein
VVQFVVLDPHEVGAGRYELAMGALYKIGREERGTHFQFSSRSNVIP